MTALLFLLGLASLIAGAELLVRGASRLAGVLGISPLIIGLTVVAFGTSAPELAVSVNAALADQAAMAVGNVVGSNIFNVLFILGVSALIAPLVVSRQLVRLDVPIMLGLSVVALALGMNGSVGRIEGIALVSGLGLYTWLLIRMGRREGVQVDPGSLHEPGAGPGDPGATDSQPGPGDPGVTDSGTAPSSRVLDVVYVAIGLGLLVLGSRWLVDSAVTFATILGVSEVVLALTIVAAGTSLPEVMTSVVAAIRGERDIAVGNVVGSNIFNIMGVMGISAVVAPDGLAISPAVLRFDLPIMIGVAFACLPIFFSGSRISRPEGGVLLAFYVAYTTFLVLQSTQHSALPMFSAAMLYFVVPLTLVTLIVIVMREWQTRR